MITYGCKTSPTLRTKHKNPPPPSTPHDLHMFRFMIILSLVVHWVKPVDGGHSQRSDLIIALSQALYFLFPFFFLGRSLFLGLVNLQDQKMNFFCLNLQKIDCYYFYINIFKETIFWSCKFKKLKNGLKVIVFLFCLAHHLLINNMR